MKDINSSKGQMTFSVTFLWLAVTFCVCLIASNTFVPRLWQVGNLPLQLTGGVLIFPISYIINDCLTEVYGYRKAQAVIWIGFAMCLFMAVASGLVTMLPKPLYPDSYAAQESFDLLFSLVPRVMVASLIAFLVGSTLNAWVMSKMKVATKGKGFGVRAIFSSVVGELADSVIFFPIALGDQLPFKGLIGIIFTQVVVKTLFEVVILPLTTIVVRKLKAFEGIDTYDQGISYNPFKMN